LKFFFQVKNVDPFVFRGKFNGKYCDFKLDTGSDVTVINPRLVDVSEKHIPIENERLRYPTGEKVPVKFRSRVKVELGKYSCKMIVYVAEIRENCILGADFCLQAGIDEVFRSAILESSQEKKSEHFLCCRISSSREFQIGVGYHTDRRNVFVCVGGWEKSRACATPYRTSDRGNLNSKIYLRFSFIIVIGGGGDGGGKHVVVVGRSGGYGDSGLNTCNFST